MRSLAYRTGAGVAAGRVGAADVVVVVADLVAGAAAAGCPVRGPGCVYSFPGACIIGGHAVEELGRLEAVVGGALA